MKRTIILVGLAIVVMACASEESSTTETNTSVVATEETETTAEVNTGIAEDVNAERFQELINSGNGLLLDVRTPEEFANGHIEGATNINFNGADFETEIDKLDKSTPVYVYCQGGGRSGKAMDMMSNKGFSEIYNLENGFGNWPY